MLQFGLTAIKTIIFFVLVVFALSDPAHTCLELIEIETAGFLESASNGIIYDQIMSFYESAHRSKVTSLGHWIGIVVIRLLITIHDFSFVGMMIIIFTTNAVLYLNRLEAARHQVNVIFDKAFKFLIFVLVVSFAMVFTHRQEPTYSLYLIYATLFCITVGIGISKIFGIKS